ALAVTTLKRTDVFPDLATVDELGLKGFDATTWHGLVTPARTPKEVVATLHRATVAALNDTVVRKQLGDLGVDIVGSTPEEFAAITLDDHTSHSHKARAVGDILIVNHERNPTAIGRRADELPRVMKELTAAKGRAPTHAEIATWLGVEPSDVAEIEAEAKRG